MDCPYRGSDRGVIPRLLDAVGVCSLTDRDVSTQQQEPALSTMFSLFVTLGVCLLLAARNPAGHLSLIVFAAWSSLAHAVVMGYEGMRGTVARGELIGVVCWCRCGRWHPPSRLS
jgi:hypothetical protein